MTQALTAVNNPAQMSDFPVGDFISVFWFDRDGWSLREAQVADCLDGGILRDGHPDAEFLCALGNAGDLSDILDCECARSGVLHVFRRDFLLVRFRDDGSADSR